MADVVSQSCVFVSRLSDESKDFIFPGGYDKIVPQGRDLQTKAIMIAGTIEIFRTRIENVLSYKKMTVILAAGFTLLIIAIIYTLLTNAG